jgi:hypothetical protein
MAKPSEIDIELYNLLIEHKVDEDSRLYIILSLKDDQNKVADMVEWLKENEDAGQSEIFDKLNELE